MSFGVGLILAAIVIGILFGNEQTKATSGCLGIALLAIWVVCVFIIGLVQVF
jgi:hypothetical protein